MAGIELSVLGRQCLARRIPDQETLSGETASWEERRNRDGIPVKWRFTVNNAPQRLSHLYPSQS